MKKVFLGLGTVAAIATPIVAVVSCGNKVITKIETKIVAHKGEDHSQEFNTIAADGVVWNAGVAYHSSSQGISYLMNIAKALGWNEPTDELDFASSQDQASANKIKAALEGLQALPTPASPANAYWIDPVGSSGTMDPWWFTNGTTHLGFDLGNTKDANNAKNTFGLNTGDGRFSNIGQVSKYQAMLDGKNPGSTIIRAWVTGLDKNKYVKTWHSANNVVRTFPKATAEQMDEISKLVIESIANIKQMATSPTLGMLSMFTNQSFVDLITWITTADLTEEKVKAAVVELNNFPTVAHHTDAVLGFLRGWKNIPAAEQPGGGAANLNGLSFISDPLNLVSWFKMTQNTHSYVKNA